MNNKFTPKIAALSVIFSAIFSTPIQALDLVTQPLTFAEYQEKLKQDKVPYTGAIPIFDNEGGIHYAFNNDEGNIPFPEGLTFKLNSKPWAKQTLYLDIHDYFYERLNTPFEFYDVDSSGGLSRAERRNLQAHFLSVVEAFSAFEINVTTEDPGLDALLRTSVDDEYFGSRVILSDGKPPEGVTDISASGSPIYEIPTTEEAERPTFVYEIRSFSYHSGGGTNHEFGHTLGATHIEPFNIGDRAVKHSSGYGETWWSGHMGTNQRGIVGHWLLPDLSSIARHEVTNTPDDHSDEFSNATPMQTTSVNSHALSHHGLIEDNQDIDVFSFTLDNNQYVEIYADTPRYVPKIDIELTLFNSSGEIIEQHNAISHLDSVVFANLEAGDYYVSIKGEGHAQSERHNGYFDFGSTGHYTLFLTERDFVTSNLALNDDRHVVSEESSITINPLDNDTVSPDATLTWIGHSGGGANRSVSKNSDNEVRYRYHSQPGFGIFAAEDEILYRVEDNGQSRMGRIIMDVQSIASKFDVHTFAQVNEDLVNILPNQMTVIDPIHNDAPLKNYSIDHSALTQPQNGQVVIRPDSKFEYTPSANFSGVDQFKYGLTMPGRSFSGHTGQASTSTQTYTATVTVQVSQGELVAGDDIRYTHEDIPVDVRVLDNDYSDQGALNITGFTQPNNGIVSQNIDKTLSYNPDADFNGQDTFTYTVSDGVNNVTKNVRIVLQATNDNPTAIADEYNIPANGSFTFNTLENDNDNKDGVNHFTLFANTQTEHGTLNRENRNGDFTYTPNKFYCGEDSFLYLIRDNLSGRDFTDVTFTITGSEDDCATETDTSIKAAFINLPDNFDFNQSIQFDIAFSSPVTGFGFDDLKLSHGIIERFEAVGNNTVRVYLRITSQEDLTLQLKDNAVTNETGLSNLASETFTLTYADTVAPDVTISAPENFRAGENITFTFKFTEVVTGFDASSISYTDNQGNGTFTSITPNPDDFEKIDDTTYSIQFPANGFFVRLVVLRNSFQDLAGNQQEFRTKSVARVTAPLATKLISIEPAAGQRLNQAQQTFLVSFNQSVANLTAQDFEISDPVNAASIAQVISRAGGTLYQVIINVAEDSEADITLKLKGELGNQGSNVSQKVDRKDPTLSIENVSFSKIEPLNIEIMASERVLNLQDQQVSVNNAMITEQKLSDDGRKILLTLQPKSLENIEVSLANNAIEDLAGNFNVNTTLSIAYNEQGTNQPDTSNGDGDSSNNDNPNNGSPNSNNGGTANSGTNNAESSGGGGSGWLLLLLMLPLLRKRL